MLEIQILKNRKPEIIEGLQKRGWSFDQLSVIEEIISLEEHRKNKQQALDFQQTAKKQNSDSIQKLSIEGRTQETAELKLKAQIIRTNISDLEREVEELNNLIFDKLVKIPNIPHYSVPFGTSPAQNQEYKRSQTPINIFAGNWAKPHWDLGKKYNILDLELGAFLCGSAFPVFIGKGARLARALINFFLDEARTAGYLEVSPPLLVNNKSAFGTGQLPDKEAQMYVTKEEGFYLIPTSEVPLTNIYRDKIIPRDQLPIRLTAYTPCFRREAGSYGSEVKGLNRVHQFDKVEIVQFVKPENSYDVLEEMVNHVASLLDKLELPYRIMRLCGGDMGFNSALTYDFEVLAEAQERWLEVSSVSNFETYQSNRMKIRYKEIDGKSRFVHTLNGSALALPRIIAALLENNQTIDGIRIPKALVPYTGFELID